MAISAQTRGWGHPDDTGYRASHIVTISAGGVRLHVRREVAHLFAGFCDEIVALGYELDDVADDWGWNNRDIRGRPGVKSNHAWGLAIDLNATTNPMASRLITDMPAFVRLAAARWGLHWGGLYKTRPDAMHFEFLGRPADVAMFPVGPDPIAPAPALEEDPMDAELRQLLERSAMRTVAIHETVLRIETEAAEHREAVIASAAAQRDSLAALIRSTAKPAP